MDNATIIIETCEALRLPVDINFLKETVVIGTGAKKQKFTSLASAATYVQKRQAAVKGFA